MNRIFALAFTGFMMFAASAIADETQEGESDNWDISIGGGALVGPVSPGIDAYTVTPIPFVNVTYRNRVFLDGRRGAGIFLFNGENAGKLVMGAAIGYDGGREESDAETELDGLGDIDPSAEIKLFLERRFGPVKLEGELAQGLGDDGHGGLRAKLAGSFGVPITENWLVSGGPFVTFGDEDYLQSYYGVTAEQAARSSRFEQNTQDAGAESAGVSISTRYSMTDNWTIIGLANYQYLVDGVADSPIVENNGNLSGGFFITYTFD